MALNWNQWPSRPGKWMPTLATHFREASRTINPLSAGSSKAIIKPRHRMVPTPTEEPTILSSLPSTRLEYTTWRFSDKKQYDETGRNRYSKTDASVSWIVAVCRPRTPDRTQTSCTISFSLHVFVSDLAIQHRRVSCPKTEKRE